MGAQVTIDRRRALVGGGALALALAVPGFAATGLAAPRVIPLAVSATRTTSLVVWSPSHPRGVALFSTGLGSWPERYTRLTALLLDEGFAVLAPIHVDSMHYPDRARFTTRQSFGERLADGRATAAWAAASYPGLPLIAAGHSFGSLIALCEGGALATIAPFRLPAVKAALAFSTPGRIPSLIGAQAYASTAVPLMVVTGSADRLPADIDYPSVPADHLLPAQTTAHRGYALVVDGGDHHLVDDAAGFARAATPVRLFVEAYGLDDRRARRRLDRWRPHGRDRWIARKEAA